MTDDASKPKRPSGAAQRKARREREEAERLAAAARGDRARPPAPALEGPQRLHTWASLIIAAQMREVYEDPLLLDEKRWRLLAELARALGMLQAKVEKEQEIADLAERINRIEREVRR